MVSFLYNEYFYSLFLVPLTTGIMIVVSSIYFCVCCLFEKNRIMGILKAILIVLASIWMFSGACYDKLRNGGIYLVAEKETDAIVKESIIENIFDPSSRLHGFKSNYGADIEVDVKLYFIESVEGLNLGDRVVFKFLPKSTCVLEIMKVNREI